LPCVVALGAGMLACADAGPDETSDPGPAAGAHALAAGDAGPGCVDGDALPASASDGLSAEQTIEAHARQRTAASCTVQLTHRGEPLQIEYQIK
jgi:hypothetical protein